jgi:predicted TIM-barrel fold metal-dependent hydrolase
MSPSLPIVDADGHVDEVHVDWQQRLPKQFAPAAPQLRHEASGSFRLYMEGKPWPKPNGPGLGLGGPFARPHPNRPGMKNPSARLADMDNEGIEVAVLFGAVLAGSIPALEDATFAAALATTRNNWLAEYCSENPARLKAVAVLAQQDLHASLNELIRCRNELGFVGVSLLPNVRGRHLGDPYYFPLYAEAERLNVPICVHMFLGRYGSEATGTMRVDKFFYSHLFGHVFEQMTAVAVLAGEGVCDRFPMLRFVFLESGCGWLPSWLNRLDEHIEVLGAQLPQLRSAPRRLFERGRFYISCEADESELAHVIDVLGDQSVVFASDYSHFDSRFPGAAKPILDNPAITESAKRRILNDNARQLYGFES